MVEANIGSGSVFSDKLQEAMKELERVPIQAAQSLALIASFLISEL